MNSRSVGREHHRRNVYVIPPPISIILDNPSKDQFLALQIGGHSPDGSETKQLIRTHQVFVSSIAFCQLEGGPTV